MNLALAADVVVAAREASFSLAFIRIGLCPDGGGTFFLPRLAGDARARARAMLGETISAEMAVQFGLIWKCFEADRLMTEAHTIAENLAAKPAKAIAAMKVAFNASWNNTRSPIL
jgi:2-(1,2-epoxy-1,2-dihydrophenyl)acetyl-CoA isomerase